MKNEIEKIKGTIKTIFEMKRISLKEIILFGSRARGDFDNLSDWDILVITRDSLTLKQKREIGHLIRKSLGKNLIPCDVIIKSECEINNRKNIPGSLIRTALMEGKKI